MKVWWLFAQVLFFSFTQAAVDAENDCLMNKNAKIYIAGHTGLVGSALMRLLVHEGYTNIVTRTFAQLDLRSQQAVNNFFEQEKVEYVFLAAAKVGGIKANNDYPADFGYDNCMIACNIIHAAHTYKVKKLLFLGSSCIYPKLCAQPMREEYLLTGPLETTNELYALAKIMGLKLCQAYKQQYGDNFISCMPTNLYGLYDNFDLESSHVIPALIAKIHKAKQENAPSVHLWGTGKARREFLFVDDLAQALLFLMCNYNEVETINIGTGVDISIAQLAQLIKTVVGYTGEIKFDLNNLDGTPQKLLSVDRLQKSGWSAETSLDCGLRLTYEWYLGQLR